MEKILLIDDHAIIRSGIKILLSRLFKQSEIHEVSNEADAVKRLKENTYVLILMDIQMPGSNALGLMKYIHTNFAATKVLIFSMNAENIYARRFLEEGAKGFVSKDAPVEELINAINLIYNNRKYISAALTDTLINEPLYNRATNPFELLSKREFELIALLLSGQTIKEISASLGLHVSTIGTYKSRMFEKLHIDNVLQLKELTASYNI